MKFQYTKHIFTLIFVIAFILGASSQALLSTLEDGATEPDPSAALHIESDNSGLLIPFVILNHNDQGKVVAPDIPATPADGLMIFHNGLNDIDKGLWYYNATLPGWVLYSDFSSTLAETSLDDFGELHESNDIGNGTPYDLDPSHFVPWKSAIEGLSGNDFNFLDDEPVNTAEGVMPADQFEINGQEAIYSVTVSATIAASAPSTTMTGAIFVNDVKMDNLFFRHTFQLKDKPTSLKTIGNVEIHIGDRLDFRFSSDTKNKGIEIENLNMRLTKMGDL